MLARRLFLTVTQKMSMSYAAKHLEGVVEIHGMVPVNSDSSSNSGSVVKDLQNNTDKLNALKLQSSEEYLSENDGRPFSIQKSNDYVEIRVPVPWGHIAAKAWGNSKGEPLLGVHGWMDNSGTFDMLVPFLPKSFYFVAVDLPGHGFSSHLPPGVPYHYTDFLTSLRRIVKHFKWNKFSWIGHSMGAGLGSLYSSIYSSEVERLILIDLLKPVTGENNTDAKRVGSSIDQYLLLEQKITANPPTYSYQDAVERLMKATDNSLSEKSAKILMARGSRRISEDKWIYTRDLRLRSPTVIRFSHQHCFDILNEIKCPTLAIKALGAPWFEKKEIGEKVLEIYKAKCKSFQYVEVPGNHFVHINEPEIIGDKISSFLLEQKSGL